MFLDWVTRLDKHIPVTVGKSAVGCIPGLTWMYQLSVNQLDLGLVHRARLSLGKALPFNHSSRRNCRVACCLSSQRFRTEQGRVHSMEAVTEFIAVEVAGESYTQIGSCACAVQDS